MPGLNAYYYCSGQIKREGGREDGKRNERSEINRSGKWDLEIECVSGWSRKGKLSVMPGEELPFK
jgi:hypothetical protein